MRIWGLGDENRSSVTIWGLGHEKPLLSDVLGPEAETAIQPAVQRRFGASGAENAIEPQFSGDLGPRGPKTQLNRSSATICAKPRGDLRANQATVALPPNRQGATLTRERRGSNPGETHFGGPGATAANRMHFSRARDARSLGTRGIQAQTQRNPGGDPGPERRNLRGRPNP